MQEAVTEQEPMKLHTLIEWRSKGRGVVNKKTGLVVSVCEAGEEPCLPIEDVLKLVKSGNLPADAEWSKIKFRSAKVNYPTFICWAFFVDIAGRRHHGFYRPNAARVRLIQHSPKSIVELYNE